MLLINLYSGEQFSANNRSPFNLDTLNYHTFSKNRDMCCYSVFGKIMTQEEVDYMLKYDFLDPNSLSYARDTLSTIYIENCKTITRDNLQTLSKLNVIGRFDSKKLYCHVHNATMLKIELLILE
jgi:hypothetical protein